MTEDHLREPLAKEHVMNRPQEHSKTPMAARIRAIASDGAAALVCVALAFLAIEAMFAASTAGFGRSAGSAAWFVRGDEDLGTLSARVLDESYRPVEDALIQLEDPEGRVWTLSPMGDGRPLEETGLPITTPLNVSIYVGNALWAKDVDTIEFDAPKTLEQTWSINATTTVGCTLLDVDGSTLAGQDVQLFQTTNATPAFRYGGRVSRAVATATTDMSGHVTFRGITPGHYSLRRAFQKWRPVDPVPAAPLLFPFDVPRNEYEIEQTIRLVRREPLAGVVRGPNGEAPGWVQVKATHPDHEGCLLTKPDPDGRFNFGPMPLGDCILEVTYADKGWMLDQPIVAASGTEDVAIQLLNPTRVFFDVLADVDFDGYVVVVPSTSPTTHTMHTQRTIGPGKNTVQFDGLRPGRYSAYFYCADVQLYAQTAVVIDRSKGLRTQSKLELQPAATVDVLNETNERIYVYLTSDGNAINRGEVMSGSTARLNLPEGEFEAHWVLDEEVHSAVVRTRVGSPAELVVSR